MPWVFLDATLKVAFSKYMFLANIPRVCKPVKEIFNYLIVTKSTVYQREKGKGGTGQGKRGRNEKEKSGKAEKGEKGKKGKRGRGKWLGE